MDVHGTGSLEAVATSRHLLGSGAVVALAGIGSLWWFEARWQRAALLDVPMQPGGWAGAILLVAVSALLHELLHGLGWHVFGRVPWRSISIRRSWRGMGIVARAGGAQTARAFRAGTALPALALVAVPVTLGLVTGGGLLVVWGVFFLLECFTDLATLLAARRVPAGAWVRSHPTKLGCQVIADGAAPASG